MSTMLLIASLFCQAADFTPLKITKDGIEYHADHLGNRVMDYSYCGYQQSNLRIPDVKVAVYVSPRGGDQADRIQAAIDYVSAQKPDKETGLRGAVLLGEGVFSISKPLRISASGVVLRGMSKTRTVLSKQGVDRGAAVYVEGKNDMRILETFNVTDDYAPAGGQSIHISFTHLPLRENLRGTDIVIQRISSKEWIEAIGCDAFGGGLGYWGWKPGEMDVFWERTIVELFGNELKLDVPLSASIDLKMGGAKAMRYAWPGRIVNCGVENLTIEAPVVDNNMRNEDHCWDGIYMDNLKNCWVRMVNFRGLAGSAVIIHKGGSQITVEDCISKQPQSEIGGLRRRTFLTMGGMCLFQRCYSEEGINDFSAGYCAPGPNAFVQCDAVGSHGFSGSSSSWATGLLFDNVNIEGGSISFKNLGLDKWGAGWNTANSMLWQCQASKIDCYNMTKLDRCYAVGCWAYCQGDGYWLSTNDHVNPYSLFMYQLDRRHGKANAPFNRFYESQESRLLQRPHDGSTSPTEEQAYAMAQQALQPRLTMEQWIDQAQLTASVNPRSATDVDHIHSSRDASASSTVSTMKIAGDGAFIEPDGSMMTGSFHRTPWWNGRTRYPYMAKADYAVTRFVPGMEQRGGTDRMDSIIANIRKDNVVVWNQNYGLWYDRRRDDHERIKRTDGDVWAPFFEQSIARSGEGQAWDGLSLYDLGKLNKWYFSRINQLAAVRPQMLIINQHFFQHNILEAGAHWVDCPWRSANNIQSTGVNAGKGTKFLEPVPFTGDKRIFTADLFYDITDAERAQLYRNYIWNVLNETAGSRNIFHSISEEFTGPQHFVEFWLDCIAEWNSRTGHHANVVLNCTKDVTDAILANAKYKMVVDAVEIEQWFYDQQNLYAPKGGINLAPRQHGRLTKTGHPTFQDVYRCVSEARRQYSGKPVLYFAKEYDRHPWAVLFAGGSCPVLTIKDKSLAKAMGAMKPVFSDNPDAPLRMEGPDGQLFYYTKATSLKKSGKTFIVNKSDGTVSPLKSTSIPADCVVWVKK